MFLRCAVVRWPFYFGEIVLTIVSAGRRHGPACRAAPESRDFFSLAPLSGCSLRLLGGMMSVATTVWNTAVG